MGKDSPYHQLWRLLDHRVFGAEEAFRRCPRAARARHFLRRTKEEMVDFEGRPIFRERRCDTFGYHLTPGPDGERALYDRTTAYLLNCYNLATGNQQAVRLAMGVFQRRLASSTWALLKSFERRIEKVGALIADLEAGRIDSRGLRLAQDRLGRRHRSDHFDRRDAAEDLDEDARRERGENYEDAVLGAVVAVTIEDLREEIVTLRDLGRRARDLIDSGRESKFERFREVLDDPGHADEKWLVFSEHRDTVAGDVARRLGTLKREVERERYLHLLPAYVRRFVELASPLLGLAVRGDLDGSFSLAPTRTGALDPLLAALETHPADARERMQVRRPKAGERCVWLHPGEPVFDAMCERVLAICAGDAARGAIFVDPRATDPYLVHLGDVAVEEEGPGAESGGLAAAGARSAGTAGWKTLERRLLALRQGEDGKAVETSLEEVGLLQGAPDHPPGAVPLAVRAVALRAEAAAHLDARARQLADARREVVRAELPDRRERVRLNFNQRAAEMARQRMKLSRDAEANPGELEAVKRGQRELMDRRVLALEQLDGVPERIVAGEARFLAHALALPPSDQNEVEAFDAQVEEVAVRIAAETERGRGGAVRDVSTPAGARAAGLADHPGFDLLAEGADGRKRHIEVKGRAGRGEIWMEINEWKAACNLGTEYWLYVVYRCATAEPQLKRVRDPFTKLVVSATTRMRISMGQVRDAAEAER